MRERERERDFEPKVGGNLFRSVPSPTMCFVSSSLLSVVIAVAVAVFIVGGALLSVHCLFIAQW